MSGLKKKNSIEHTQGHQKVQGHRKAIAPCSGITLERKLYESLRKYSSERIAPGRAAEIAFELIFLMRVLFFKVHATKRVVAICLPRSRRKMERSLEFSRLSQAMPLGR